MAYQRSSFDMAYRRSSFKATPDPWQQRAQSLPMGSYGQGYSSYSGYDWRDRYPMNQVQMIDFDMPMAYDVPMGYNMSLRYENERRRNQVQVSPRRKPVSGKRLPQRSPARGPPSKRPNLGNRARATGEQNETARPRENFNRQIKDNANATARRKPVYGKRLPLRTSASGQGSQKPNFVDRTRRRNDRRRRFFRTRRNFRRPAREDSASDFEEYEILGSSENDEEKQEQTNVQNGEVDTTGQQKEGEDKKGNDDEKKDEGTEKKVVKKFTACHVCKVATTRPELLEQHMKTEEHKTKIASAVTEYREKKTAEIEKEKSQKKKSDKWCDVCEVAFSGAVRMHQNTTKHRRMKDSKFPRCRPCSTGFGSPEEFKEHTKTDSHKQKSAEFYHLRRLPVGFDNDKIAVQPAKTAEEVHIKVEVDEDKNEEKKEDKNEEKKEEKKEDKNEEKKEDKTVDKKPKKADPSPIGSSFIVEVTGFYCKLCRAFFKNERVARKAHCCSEMHSDSYKRAMEVALKSEEERQKTVDANAEAAGDADPGEIAAIQREARAALRKVAAEKRAAAKKELEQAKKEKPVEDGAEKNLSEPEKPADGEPESKVAETEDKS